MAEDQSFIPVPRKELEAIKARTAKRILSVTERSIEGLETLLHRIDGIDNALANSLKLDDMTPQDLYAYFNQAQQSFRLRQDFLRSLAGYDIDTSKVPSEQENDVGSQTIDEATAERVRQEILRRPTSHDAEIVQPEGD